METCHPSGLVVRHRRNMRPHRGNRIEKRSSVLDSCAVDRIGIVAAPDLWGIIKHSCVKPAAATAASLQQKIRIAAAQTLHEIIDTKHIIIGKISGINICHAAVHIPLDIINFSLIEHGTYLIKYTVAHFFSGKIKQ